MGSLTQTMSGKRTAVFPASFDPVTNGHLDIIRRALALNIFDEIVLAVGVNPAKRSLFSLEERVALLKEAVGDWDGQERIRVLAMEGLTADFARGVQASAILRGIRSPLDFEYEAQMYFLNRRLAPEIDTIFLLADPQYAFFEQRSCEAGGADRRLVGRSRAAAGCGKTARAASRKSDPCKRA